MVNLIWVLRIIIQVSFWTCVIGFVHYTLPQHDIVRIIKTEVRRIDLGENSWFWAQPDVGQDVGRSDRDIRFIEAFYANDRPMVYRNEDTGWGWPPYFKLSSANLQARANDMISTKDDPQWIVIRHYGWRNEFLSIYPNAVSLWSVDGPDIRIIPWVKIVILTAVAALWFTLWTRWRRFRRNQLDPILEEISDRWAERGTSNDGGFLKRVWRSLFAR